MMEHILTVTTISRPPNNTGRVDYKMDRKDEKHIFLVAEPYILCAAIYPRTTSNICPSAINLGP